MIDVQPLASNSLESLLESTNQRSVKVKVVITVKPSPSLIHFDRSKDVKLDEKSIYVLKAAEVRKKMKLVPPSGKNLLFMSDKQTPSIIQTESAHVREQKKEDDVIVISDLQKQNTSSNSKKKRKIPAQVIVVDDSDDEVIIIGSTNKKLKKGIFFLLKLKLF